MWTVEFYIKLGGSTHIDCVKQYDSYDNVDRDCAIWIEEDPTFKNFGIHCRGCRIISDSKYFYDDGLVYVGSA